MPIGDPRDGAADSPPEAADRAPSLLESVASSRVGSFAKHILEWVLSGSNWKLKSLSFVLLITFFRAFPSYDAWSSTFVKWKWSCVQAKFDHPLADTGRMFPANTHESQLTFRLTAPIVAHVLHFGQTGMMLFFAGAGLLLLYTSINLAYRITEVKAVALFTTLAIGCAWPGMASFHEFRGGYYDALALCLLLLAYSARSWWLTIALVFLAAWTDERALVAIAFMPFFALEHSSRNPGLTKSRLSAAAIGVILYLSVRAFLVTRYGYRLDTTDIGWAVAVKQLNIVPLALWSGLGVSWLIVLVATLTLFVERRYLAGISFLGVVAAASGSALIVMDVTRGASYCLPAVFAALYILHQSLPLRQIERLTAITAALAVAIPTFYIEGSTGVWWLYPLPIQVLRWLHFL